MPRICAQRSGADKIDIGRSYNWLYNPGGAAPTSAVRSLAILCAFLFCLESARAQQQETSLIDRLLRPNMELKNGAQTKKFTADKSVRPESRGTVGTFYLRPNRDEKQFAALHDYSSGGYQAREFNSGTGTVAVKQGEISPAHFPTASTRDNRRVYDAHNNVTGRTFAAEREFREQGKSQKSLDRQNPPMTIDQVRELLNKNK
ncbi:MAG TPA: hypothetical protein VH170_01830 [Chthoniobacterales bacterium]|nr:hypothetical protein [Chthoniobacterales bacterium]